MKPLITSSGVPAWQMYRERGGLLLLPWLAQVGPQIASLPAGSGLYVGAGIDIDSPEAANLQKTSAIFPTSFGFEIPNPFGSQENLFLTDSGLGDFGSTPLLSLMLPARKVEVRWRTKLPC